jgi:hypothetical protein
LGGEGIQVLIDVTAGGPGLVAVGEDGSSGDAAAAVWTSPDGITWSPVPYDEAVFGGAGIQSMLSVTGGGPGLVAVGSDGAGGDRDAAVWTSPDGITWSRVPDDDAVFGGERTEVMFDVTAGGPGLVAVGAAATGDESEAAVWTSPDGITWSRVPDDDAVLTGEGLQGMSGVTPGGPGLVAVGATESPGESDAAVWTSPDGITWSRVPNDDAIFGDDGVQWMMSVTGGGPGLVAVGWVASGDDRDAAVWTSPDGITWSRVPNDEKVFGGEGSQSMVSVTAAGLGLVAVGWEASGDDRDAAVWTSPDGITWSRVPHDEALLGGNGNQGMNSVTSGGLGLVAVGAAESGGNQDAAVWIAARTN